MGVPLFPIAKTFTSKIANKNLGTHTKIQNNISSKKIVLYVMRLYPKGKKHFLNLRFFVAL